MTIRAHSTSTTHLPPLDDPPATVLAWLVQRFPRVGEATWRSRMARGLVTRGDGSPLDASSPYEAHLRVRYFREVEDEPVTPFRERILFEDAHLVVADKPPFLPVTPSGPFVRECLLARLATRLGTLDLAPIHRLDRATSGLVVFSRVPAERGAYGELFATRRVKKVYEAIGRLPGQREPERWTVESRIVQGTPFFRMRETHGVTNARTEVELMETWRTDEGWFGRFLLRPVSGKKHQLRVHMASLGFGIVGDRVYPELLPESPDDFDAPLRLVAKELRFDDPFTDAERRFVSDRSVRDLGSDGLR